MADLEHDYLRGNGIWLHAAASGPRDGRLIIFLHGFPEFWYGWRRQLAYFARQGFRALAPDQRGYNLSDRPGGVAAYRTDALAGDVAGLARALGHQQAVIVGHDWGGVVAWRLAALYPELVERLVILNAPHPEVFREYLLAHPAQMLRSLYAAFFQLPLLPEAALGAFGWWGAGNLLRASSRPGTFSAADLHAYRQAWSRPGAMTAMLNWYRAMVRVPSKLPADAYIRPPTLVIWGQQDIALGTGLAHASLARCAQGRLVLFRDASHWVQHEKSEQVNALIHAFLTPDG